MAAVSVVSKCEVSLIWVYAAKLGVNILCDYLMIV